MRSAVPLLVALALLAALAAGCGGGGSSAEDDVATASREVDSDGVTLHAEVTGPKDASHTTIVVQGGPGLSHEAVIPFRALADDERAVVVYDQRGTGDTAAPSSGDYGIAAQVADVEALRAALDVDRIELVGVSFGGIIAAAYAAQHPDRTSALVLVAAAPLDVDEIDAGNQRFFDHIAELQADGLIPDPVPPNDGGSCLPRFEAVIPAYLDDPAAAVDMDIDVGPCAVAASVATHEQVLDPEAIDALAARLARFRGRALVVTGESDAFGQQWPERSIELLARANVERVIIPDAGHLVPRERPEELFGAIERFLDG